MTSGALRLLILFWRASYPGTRRWNPNFNQYLNREPWFATLLILNSVGVGVNPVFWDLKARLCKPVPCPGGQVLPGYRPESANSSNLSCESGMRVCRNILSPETSGILGKTDEAPKAGRELGRRAHLRAFRWREAEYRRTCRLLGYWG